MSKTKPAKSSTAGNWNIKGIEPETRERVKKAAKRAGVTMGAYVNRVLMEASTADLKRSKTPPVKLEDIQNQMSDIADRLTQLEARGKRSLWDKISGK